MPNTLYHLLAFAIAIFFFGIAWLMLRLAAAATTKQDFLASCLCLAGLGVIGLIFCHLACLPIDAYGCTHEADWEDTAIRGGFCATAAGNLVKCWQKPAFRWAVAAIVLSGIESEANVKAYLPQLAQSIVHYAATFSWVFTAHVWVASSKALRGNWFRIKVWNHFGW